MSCLQVNLSFNLPRLHLSASVLKAFRKASKVSPWSCLQRKNIWVQGRRQLREIGGRGGKIKIRAAKVFPEMRRLFLAEITNFPTKSRWSPEIKKIIIKKKVFADIRTLFLAEIANFNVFSAQTHQLLSPKKIPWGARKKSGGQKRKSGWHCPPAGDVRVWVS